MTSSVYGLRPTIAVVELVNVPSPTGLNYMFSPIVLAACSLDGNFVFSVNASDFPLPISLSSLRVKGHRQCTPAAATTDAAVFKFGVNECGAKKVVSRSPFWGHIAERFFLLELTPFWSRQLLGPGCL